MPPIAEAGQPDTPPPFLADLRHAMPPPRPLPPRHIDPLATADAASI